MLDKEFKYYLAHQKELVEDFNNQYLIIIGEKVVAHFDSFEEALSHGQSNYEIGTYLIQFCQSGEESYTQTFHTRAIFA
jgi:hypothetical protein